MFVKRPEEIKPFSTMEVHLTIHCSQVSQYRIKRKIENHSQVKMVHQKFFKKQWF